MLKFSKNFKNKITVLIIFTLVLISLLVAYYYNDIFKFVNGVINKSNNEYGHRNPEDIHAGLCGSYVINENGKAAIKAAKCDPLATYSNKVAAYTPDIEDDKFIGPQYVTLGENFYHEKGVYPNQICVQYM